MSIDLTKYNIVRVSTATPSIKVADVDYNLTEIINTTENILKTGSKICLFPELSITGYTCGDLFFQDILLEETINALIKLKSFTLGNQNTIIVGAPIEDSGKLFNCAVVISNGEISGIVPKTYLCNNSEYYEERWFSSELDRISDEIEIGGEMIPFGADLLFRSSSNKNLIFGAEICEDLWALKPPSLDMASAGATVLFNLSASNEYLGKLNYRKNIVKMQSGRCISAYVYSSSGPGESTTDTVFSGHSMIASNGKIIAETERFSFENEFITKDIDLDELQNDRMKNNSYGFSTIDKNYRIIEFEHIQPVINEIFTDIKKTPFIPESADNDEICNEIINIQTTALMKRIKHIGIKNVVIGISGGLDSTLALLICVEAFKKLKLDLKGIKTITMPGFGTTGRTKGNASKLIDILKTDYIEINISDAVKQHFLDIKHDENNYNITYENSQARERTQILMDYANKVGGIVIGTGDLSEIALGWATYNGDHMSMYGVNSGVPKTLIKFLIKWYADNNIELKSILYDIIDTPISPELLPADKNDNIIQQTENNVGPYLLNDFFLFYVVRHHFSPEKIFLYAKKVFGDEFNELEILKHMDKFYSRFFSQQFKRSAIPDGIKVGSVALSPRADWRMPSDASANIWKNQIKNIINKLN